MKQTIVKNLILIVIAVVMIVISYIMTAVSSITLVQAWIVHDISVIILVILIMHIFTYRFGEDVVESTLRKISKFEDGE